MINCDFMATNTSIPKRTNTPASSAEAMDSGMRSMMRSNHPVMPLKVMSSAENKNAPMASDMGMPTRVVASKAAPGVDQAVTTGLR